MCVSSGRGPHVYLDDSDKALKVNQHVTEPLWGPDAVDRTVLEIKDSKVRRSYISKSTFEKLKKTPRTEEPKRLILDGWKWDSEQNKYFSESNLLGEYVPSEKKVLLYEKTIDEVSIQDHVPEYCVGISTYIHEVFHYVHHAAAENNGRAYETIREIEEAMTEFSTLLLLDKLSNQGSGKVAWDKVLDWAKQSIESKQNYLGVFPAYGFGYYLFNHFSNDEAEAVKWIKQYNQKIGAIDKKNRYVKWYQQMLNPMYPYKDEKLCLELLHSILFNL
jgi:hypothetical protein